MSEGVGVSVLCLLWAAEKLCDGCLMLPKIEKGIPVPYTTNRGQYVDTLKNMAPGDSVLYTNVREATGLRNAGAAKHKKMTVRKVADGYRVWYVGEMVERELE